MKTTQELIDKLTSAISFKFKEDGTSPGLTISRLKNKNYYCSVVRYPKAGTVATKGKVVVCKAEAASLSEAVEKVAAAFLKVADVELNPLQELAKVAEELKL